MASPQSITRISSLIVQFGKYSPATLIKRERWGEINFEEAGLDIERANWLANQFKTAPIEYMPENVVSDIAQHFERVLSGLQAIDTFTLSSDNPAQQRNRLVSQLRSHVDALCNATSSWIPFLALRRSDQSQARQQLDDVLQQAKDLMGKVSAEAASRNKELEQLVINAKQASAKIGVAVFTEDFRKEAVSSEKAASKWLWAAAVTVCLTLFAAFFFWLLTEAGLDNGQIIQKVSTKLFVLALLVTATVWCGRNYKALKHQATTNRHRALSIQTFQAFSGAANDAQTKDAVLLEATRAVFGSTPTGYIEGGGSDHDLKVIEIARSVLPKSNAE